MRACVKEAKCKLTVREIDMPQRFEKDDVLIKVTKVGICGSDVHLWELEDRIGLVMGHEFCGVVVDPGTSSFKAGQRVVVIPKGPRGYYSTPGVHAQGAFAEYFYAAAKFVRAVPDNIDDNAANMIEPCGIAYKAVLKANIQVNDKVLVTGTGIIGLLAAAWAKAMGAQYVALTEVNDNRIAIAGELSDADEVFDAKAINIENQLTDATNGGFDKVIECTAATSAINLAINVMKHGGRMILLGVNYKQIPINTLKIMMNELVVEGSFGSSVVFDKVIELLSQDMINITKYITKEIGFKEIQEAFEELHSGNSSNIKIVISP